MNEMSIEPIRRKGETELLISARMPKMHELMSRASAGIGHTTTNKRWEHLEYFDLPYYHNNGLYHIGKWGWKIFTKGGPYWNFNLSMLRSTDLDTGIEIELKPNFDLESKRWQYLERDLARAIHDLANTLHKESASNLKSDLYLNEQKVSL
jgi:hypothetical protein